MSLISLLNKTCTIQVRSKSQDSDTGQMIETWTNQYTGILCCINTLRGNERIIDDKKGVFATHRLYMEYRTGLDEGENRIVVDSSTFNIVGIGDGSGRNHHMEIDLEIIK